MSEFALAWPTCRAPFTGSLKISKVVKEGSEKKKPVVLAPDHTLKLTRTFLDKLKISDYLLKSTIGGVHIYTLSLDVRQRVVTGLKTLDIKHHTYAQRSGKRTEARYVIKNLNVEIPIQDVGEAFRPLGARDVRRLLRTDAEGKKTPLSPIVITVQSTVTIEDVKKVRHVNKCIFTVVKYIPKKEGGPPQCFRCHTKNYCGYELRCVRCGKNHHISICPRTSPHKCPNCSQDHVASFRQCETRVTLLKEAENLKNKLAEQKKTPLGNKRLTTTQRRATRIVRGDAPYSDILRPTTTPQTDGGSIPDQVEETEPLHQLLVSDQSQLVMQMMAQMNPMFSNLFSKIMSDMQGFMTNILQEMRGQESQK
ncbi:uncharacterized protein [Halyomorpha halys]|uniref:uncharacterized protein n=1 Tax=Halyomorpha halys TaxID=286706 RepID=UPI0034D22DA7